MAKYTAQVTLTAGDIDFLVDLVDFAQDLIDAFDALTEDKPDGDEADV
jgi:hypothetical protein